MFPDERIALSWLEGAVPPRDEIDRPHLPRIETPDLGDAEAVERWLAAAARQRDAKNAFQMRVSHALPCREALDTLRPMRLIEVGAGRALWAALLARGGGDIIATDLHPYGDTYHPVEAMDAEEAIRTWADRDVLMIWPSFRATWSARGAKAMAPGRRLALVTEDADGCIGCPGLFAELRRGFTREASIPLPNWHGIHDRLEIHIRV